MLIYSNEKDDDILMGHVKNKKTPADAISIAGISDMLDIVVEKYEQEKAMSGEPPEPPVEKTSTPAVDVSSLDSERHAQLRERR
eukprot:5642788-Pyramimonas_sp.AAC.1